MELPNEAHAAIICGQTGCGKTVFALDLLEGRYRGIFKNIVILCTTLEHNETYKSRKWMSVDPGVYSINPGDKLNEYIKLCFTAFSGEPTLYLIDDCSAAKDMAKKRESLAELAFSGRHAKQSVWVLTQKYNSVLKDFREQTKWTALFHCKDRDSFEECLKENDVISSKEERDKIRKEISDHKHSKLVLKTDQPVEYRVE